MILQPDFARDILFEGKSEDIFKVMSGGIFFSQAEIKSNTISIYPNPATNEINISGQIIRATIFSIDGKIIKESTSTSIDISILKKGTYLLKVENAEGVAFARFVVL